VPAALAHIRQVHRVDAVRDPARAPQVLPFDAGRGGAGGGWPCCLWPEVTEQGPGAPGAIGLGQEPDLGFEAAVVRLRGLPAESVVNEVVQVRRLQAESRSPGGQLFRIARLAADPGRAGAGAGVRQSAGAGQEDGLGFQAGDAAQGGVEGRVIGDDVRPQVGDGLGPGGVFLGAARGVTAPCFLLAVAYLAVAAVGPVDPECSADQVGA
jgi:hypothetical protein